jgi:hypothetical protein
VSTKVNAAPRRGLASWVPIHGVFAVNAGKQSYLGVTPATLFFCPADAYIGSATRKGGYGDKWPS